MVEIDRLLLEQVSDAPARAASVWWIVLIGLAVLGLLSTALPQVAGQHAGEGWRATEPVAIQPVP